MKNIILATITYSSVSLTYTHNYFGMSFHVIKDVRSDTLDSRKIYHRKVLSGSANTAGFITGTSELVEILAPSSLAAKENVVSLEDVGNKFSKLRPVRYDVNHEGCRQSSVIGLIAEEVKECFPEFVLHDVNGVVKGVDYSKLVVLAIQQLHQQKEINQWLEDRITELENRK